MDLVFIHWKESEMHPDVRLNLSYSILEEIIEDDHGESNLLS